MQPYRACKRKQPAPECDSAIRQHLLENDQRAASYDEDQFPFHLGLLEASRIYVRCSSQSTST